MISLLRNYQKNYKTTQMLYQPLKGSEALDVLINRDDLSFFNFMADISVDNYSFHYYSENYKIGLQIDAQTDLDESAYNMEGIKTFNIPSLGIRVLKISDYQLLTDLDEIARRLRLLVSTLH